MVLRLTGNVLGIYLAGKAAFFSWKCSFAFLPFYTFLAYWQTEFNSNCFDKQG
jgi:hypothetical protein